MGPPGHGDRRRLPGRRAGLATARAPHDPPDGHAAHRLPARGVGDASAASAATPTSCSRSVNGIAFFTSLWRWLRKPRVLLVFHVHQEHYVTELGLARARRRVRCSSTCPLRLPLSRRAGRHDLAGLARGPRRARGRARAHPRRLPAASTPACCARAARRAEPTLVYLGRLKQYKRIELLLDVAEPRPRGAPRPRRRRRPPRRARGRGASAARSAAASTFHGHVDEEREGAAARRGVGRADRVLGRGLVPDRDRGRRVRARRPPRCASAASPRRSSTAQTGVLADDARRARRRGVRDARRPTRAAARRWARPRSRARAASRGTTRHRARSTVMDARDAQAERPRLRDDPAALGVGQGGRARRGDAGQQRDPARLHRRLHAPARRRPATARSPRSSRPS